VFRAMKKIVISGILAATVIVAGIFAAGSNIFNSVEAQQLKSVLVINDDAHPVPIVGTTPCPRENVQHWDKIVFEVGNDVVGDPAGGVVPPQPLVPGRVYDIKVIDDPHTVADVTEKLIRFLQTQGYIIVDPSVLKITDVEYAIICTK
jgi:hypothetical protein